MKAEEKSQSKRQNMLARRNRGRLIAALGAMVVVATALALMVPALSMTRGMLACGLEEHEHSDACYEQVLVCGLEESEGHEHDADCYEAQLVCELPEHVHSSACYDAPDKSEGAGEVSGGEAASDVSAGEGAASESTSSASDNNSQSDSSNAANSASSDNAAASSSASADSAGSAAAIKTESDGETDESADDDANAMPAQKFQAGLKDADGNTVLTVRVDAPKGAFPAEAFMKVDGVLAKDVQARVKEAVLKAIGLDEESLDGADGDGADAALSNGVLIERMDAVDITFFDKDGNQVQPSKKVVVEIASDQVRDAKNLALVHVLEVDGIVKNADGGIAASDGKPFENMADAYKGAEVVEDVRLVKEGEGASLQDADTQDPNPQSDQNALTFKAQEFSPYVLVNLSDDAAAALNESMPKAVVSASAAGEAPQGDAKDANDANVIESENRPAQSFRQDITDESGATVLTVTVEAPEGSLTANSSMVAELVEDEDVLEAAKDEAINSGIGQNADATAANTNAVAADITFLDAEGNKQEPAGDVRVTMTSPVVASEGDVAVVHVEDDLSTQLVDSPDVDAAQEAVAFDASNFSVYAIVYTVDFHWEVDGKTYTFSIPGGGFMSFYNLVETLGIAADEASTEKDEIQELVDGVQSVEFSNPELVSVSEVEEDTTVGAIKDRLGLKCVYSAELTEEQIAEINAQEAKAGDWALISLKAFTSVETLTVTMKNGDQWVVKVTDDQISDFDQLVSRENYVLYIEADGNYYALDGQGNTVLVPDNNLDALSSEYLWRFNNQENGDLAWDDASSWVNLNGHNFLDVYYTNKDNPVVSEFNTLNEGETWLPIVTLVPNDGGFYFRDLNPDHIRDGYFGVRYYHIRLLVDDYNSQTGTHHLKTVFGNEYFYDYFGYQHGNPYSGAATIYVYKQGSAYTVKAQSNDEEFGHVKYTHGATSEQTSASHTPLSVQTEKNVDANKTVPGTFEVIPANGYIFTGWTIVRENTYDNHEVTSWGDSGASSASPTIHPTVNGNLVLQANFKPEKLYKFTVTTNDETMGTVGGGDEDGNTVAGQKNFTSISGVVINDKGRNAYELTATALPLHKFVEWQLKDSSGRVTTIDGETIAANTLELKEDNMTLTAVFRKKTDTEIDETDIDTLLGSWKTDMTSDFVGVDKTAHVHDYENRIYEIDLSASSGKWAVENSINLDFITDTSRSMYFPANLEEAGDFTAEGLVSWLEANGTDHEQVYYVVSDVYTKLDGTQENSAQMFAIYYDGGWKYIDSSYYYYDKPLPSNTAERQYRSVNATNVNHITLQYTGATNTKLSPKRLTGKIYVSSAPPSAYQSHDNSSNGQAYWSRLDYLFKAVMTATETLKNIDPKANVGLTTFNAESEHVGNLKKTEEEIFGQLNNISLSGGTRQDEGLYTSRTGEKCEKNAGPGSTTGVGANSVFKSNSNNQQFAIIITDGAPNGAEWGNANSGIIQQANLLKAITDKNGKKLTLMTLGVGSNFVGNNKGKFDALASEPKYAENANNGGQIVQAIKDLVQSMVVKAALFGKVSDTLDPAFYPVKSDGTPITAGYYTMDGNPYTPSANDTSEYCQWTQNGGSWTVTYYNQTFKWPTRDENGNITENGWDRAFYAKAKENFLGGNTIETNSVGSTAFTATDTILLDNNMQERPGTKAQIKDKDGKAKPIVKNDVPTPHVNVKQLTLTQNDTKWTVYIQTEVDPLPQIKELYNNIKVLEVVDASTNNMITNNSAMLFDPGAGTKPEAFLLSEALGVDASQIDWTKLTGEPGYVDIPYTKYDHATGYVRLTLTKSEMSNYDKHKTSTNLIDEEEYVLTAQFIPYSVDTMLENHGAETSAHDKQYHTTATKPTDTTPKSPGAVQMDGRPSVNNHIIELFVRGLSITKANDDFSQGLTGAEFTFYRPATAEEIAANKEGIKELDGAKYYPQQDLSFDDRGVAYINGVRQLSSPETKYYLLETKAPEGYELLEEPIPVTLTVTDTFTILPVAEGQDPLTQAAKPSSGLFNWAQAAKLEITGAEDIVKRTTGAYSPNDPATDLTDVPVTASSQYEVMYYRIKNLANTVDITFQKVDEKSAGLPGAVFQLVVLDDEGANPQTALTKEGYTGITGLGDVVEGDKTYGSAIKSDGTAQAIGKLPNGKYRLVEKSAPDGYVVEKSEWNFEIKDGTIISRDEGMGTGLALVIANKPGAALPNTGGPGTEPFVVVGGVLVAASVAFLWRRKRTN